MRLNRVVVLHLPWRLLCSWMEVVRVLPVVRLKLLVLGLVLNGLSLTFDLILVPSYLAEIKVLLWVLAKIFIVNLSLLNSLFLVLAWERLVVVSGLILVLSWFPRVLLGLLLVLLRIRHINY